MTEHSRTSLSEQNRIRLAAYALASWERTPVIEQYIALQSTDLSFLACEVSHLLDLPVSVVAAAFANLVEEGVMA